MYSCSNMELFSVGNHCMRLNSKTLENLEIFQNLVGPMQSLCREMAMLSLPTGGQEREEHSVLDPQSHPDPIWTAPLA